MKVYEIYHRHCMAVLDIVTLKSLRAGPVVWTFNYSIGSRLIRPETMVTLTIWFIYCFIYWATVSAKSNTIACTTHDLNSAKDCAPVNCEEKYFGKRNFFNNARNICEVAPSRILPQVILYIWSRSKCLYAFAYHPGYHSRTPPRYTGHLTTFYRYSIYGAVRWHRSPSHECACSIVLINLFMASLHLLVAPYAAFMHIQIYTEHLIICAFP